MLRRSIVTARASLKRLLFFVFSSCWLSVDNGLIWSFVGPALLIIVVSSHFCLWCRHNESNWSMRSYNYIGI